jgi:ABC-type transport system involved in multi-copper enzyme maturation permease subunit
MTRFAWLQTRTQTLISLALLAGLGVLAAITGVQLSHLYTNLVAHCQSGCDLAAGRFLSHAGFLSQLFDLLARAGPALIGIFLGAPLVARELETGTHRLAWTQTITRRRWVGTKVGLVGFASVVAAGALALTVTWWSRAVDVVNANQYSLFDRRGVVIVGYGAFAFASGAFIGAVIRHTVPAMATTLAVYAFTLVAVASWVRPHLLSPATSTVSLLDADQFGFSSSNGAPLTIDAQASGPPNSWTLSSRIVDSSGHTATAAERAAFLHQYCPTVGLPSSAPSGHATVGPAPDRTAVDACRTEASKAFHLVVRYLPADRYWTLQWLELGIFVGLALVAAVACCWWVTRHTS